MASLDSTDGGIDSVDSAQLINENDDPLKLKLENVRLHSLLFEVEKARAGSVKALLHVNNLLNKVQSDNIHLEGEMKVCILEKDKLNENIKTLQDNTENGNSIIQKSDYRVMLILVEIVVTLSIKVYQLLSHHGKTKRKI